ncbi:MAG: rod shape-determining protein RodA [Eubacteriales bacterium]
MRFRFINIRFLKHIDWVTVSIVFAICLFGLVAIINATSSPFTGDESTLSDYLSKLNFSYVKLQLMWVLVGLIAVTIVLIPDYSVICDYSRWIYWFNIALLLLVFLTTEVRGMQGWFKFGSRGFQPSEVAKISLIIVLAKKMSESTRGGHRIERIKDVFPVALLFALPFGLIVLQKDIGTALVFLVIFFGMLFVGRTNLKIIGMILLVGIIMLPLAWLVMNSTQKARIVSFLNPGADTQGTGYQVSQAKIAIGAGQFAGKGFFSAGALGQLNYVPDSHTDFIFGVTVEAVGFIGAFFLMGLYLALLLRALYIASKAKDDQGMFLVSGVVCMLLFHIFENLGMNMGIMPVTGIPLPFFSYGGSSMLANMIAVGLILNVNARRFRWSLA